MKPKAENDHAEQSTRPPLVHYFSDTSVLATPCTTTDTDDASAAESWHPTRGHKRVLVVDDCRAVRSAFRLALEETPIELVFATNGEVGLDIMKKGSVDVAYVDLRMPGMNGIEVLCCGKAAGADSRVCLMTAFVDEYSDTMQAAARFGLNFDLLFKPISYGQIYDLTARMTGAFKPRGAALEN